MLALPLIGCSTRANCFGTSPGQHSRVVAANRGTGEWAQKMIKREGWPHGLSCSDVGKGKMPHLDPCSLPVIYCRQEDLDPGAQEWEIWSCLSPALGRLGPAPTLGSTTELALLTVVPGTHLGDLSYGGVGEGEMISPLPCPSWPVVGGRAGPSFPILPLPPPSSYPLLMG